MAREPGGDYVWGSLSGRWLMVRPVLPMEPWWRAAFRRTGWRVWARVFRRDQHRCYCPEGWAFDGHVVIAGVGLQWFYSRYTGTVPCVCDEALQRWREEREA